MVQVCRNLPPFVVMSLVISRRVKVCTLALLRDSVLPSVNTRNERKIFRDYSMMKTTRVPFTKYAENLEAKVILHTEVVVYGSQSHSKTQK